MLRFRLWLKRRREGQKRQCPAPQRAGVRGRRTGGRRRFDARRSRTVSTARVGGGYVGRDLRRIGFEFLIVERIMFEPALRPGCPVVAVTLAADDPDKQLRASASSIFRRWGAAISECLVRAGVAR